MENSCDKIFSHAVPLLGRHSGMAQMKVFEILENILLLLQNQIVDNNKM